MVARLATRRNRRSTARHSDCAFLGDLGAPVAVVTSLVIGSPFLRARVNAAVGFVPLVVAGAALWVAVARRLGPATSR